jgi:hypothetical protein
MKKSGLPVHKSTVWDQSGFVRGFPRDSIAAPGGRLEERLTCRVVEHASAGHAPGPPIRKPGLGVALASFTRT